MLKKLKDFCFALGVFSLVAVPVLIPAAVSADIAGQLCSGANANNPSTTLDLTGNGDASCASDTSGSGSSIQKVLSLIINIFSIIVGFVAVVMIIFGGIKYITSGGESSNISGAKNTIVYAIIGLVIVALSQVLVHFVLAKTAATTSGSGSAG
jgi:hypothetical protein